MDADAGTGADAGTLTRQQTWAPRSSGVSKQAFLLTLGPVLDTLCRHGCHVFLHRLPGADLAVGHGVACIAHRSVEAGPGRRGSTTSWSRGSPGEGEAELLRITCEETFLRRQQRRLLHGIFAATHGEDADAVECVPEVEVAFGPAPTGLHVPVILFLVGLTNLVVPLFLG